MTEQQKQHAARMLMRSKELMGGEEAKFLPKLYIVDGKGYFFLNAARRAAYGTSFVIEVMTIEDAWEISMGLSRESFDRSKVEWEFDQTGGTFDGRLFMDSTLLAGMVPNPVIKIIDSKADKSAILDVEINRMYLNVRAQNILMKTACRTYGDLLKLSRDKMSKMRNVGNLTLCEFDTEMDRVGLLDNWKNNKSVI